MTRVSDSGVGARFHVPGCYEKLVVGRCRCGFPCRSDPRLGLQELTADQRTLFEWFTAQCAWEAQHDKAARLAAGAPFEVPRWRVIGGRDGIPRNDTPPQWDSVQTFRVFSDDTIAPMYDNKGEKIYGT